MCEFYDRRYAYWCDRVPWAVAQSQAAWERIRLIGRLAEQGVPRRQIAERLEISLERVRQMILVAEMRKNRAPPIHRYFNGEGDVALLWDKIKVVQRRRLRQTASYSGGLR